MCWEKWWLTVELNSWHGSGPSMRFLSIILGPIHGFVHKRICCPVSMCHTIPFWQNYHPSLTTTEIWDLGDRIVYLWRSMDAQSDEGNLNSLHSKAPKGASFLILRFWIPKSMWNVSWPIFIEECDSMASTILSIDEVLSIFFSFLLHMLLPFFSLLFSLTLFTQLHLVFLD